MRIQLTRIQRIIMLYITAAVLFPGDSNADTAFGYSEVGYSLGKVTFGTPFVFNGVIYNSMLASAFSASYQANDYFVIGVDSAATMARGYGTEISGITTGLRVGLIANLTPSADAIFSASSASSTAEACVGIDCIKEQDNGLVLSLAMRSWITPEMEISAGFADNNYRNSDSFSSYAIGVAPHFGKDRNHSFNLSFGNDSNSNKVLSLGYTYIFNPPSQTARSVSAIDAGAKAAIGTENISKPVTPSKPIIVPSQNIYDSSIPQKLRELKSLRDDNVLTEEEYQKKKTQLLEAY